MAAKKAAKKKRTRRALESKLVAGKQQGRRGKTRAAPRAVAVKKGGNRRGAQLAITRRTGGARPVGGKGSVPKARGITVNRTAKRVSGGRSGGG